MVLLSTVVIWFVYAKERDPNKTAEERSIDVYKEMLVIEVITMGISIFFSIFIGYMYEIWSRKKVLFVCFFFLAVGMVLPETGLVEEQDKLYWVGRIATSVLATAILQNPLLNDYVKKHNRGWANAMQVLGKEIGEVLAFILIYEGIHKDPENQKYIFYGMTGVVFAGGLLITIFMVKDKPPKRDYVQDEKTGEVKRHKVKVEADEDPNDTGSDIDLYIPETAAFFKGVTLSCWGKTKLLIKQTWNAIRSDLMT